MEHPPCLKGFDAVIPLYHRYRAIGFILIGDVEEEHQGISPTIKHLKLIQIISNLIIVFIENKRMQNALLEQQALQRELELASRIQQQLVPSVEQLPQSTKFKIRSIYHPHLGVGGDYYDAFMLSRNTVGFCVADVSGKGISAAILMSNFQAVMRTLFTARVNLKTLIHQLNARVNESANNEKFITLFIGRYNLLTRRMSYVNAGHLPPLLYDKNRKHLLSLEKGSIGLGMLDFIPTVEVGRVRVRKGAKLLAFTDGIVELDDGSQVESGTEDIERILANSNSLDENFEELNVEVDALLEKGSVFDDISLLGMEFM